MGDAGASSGSGQNFDGNAECDCVHAGGESVNNRSTRCATKASSRAAKVPPS
jgi:hypothetical protein